MTPRETLYAAVFAKFATLTSGGSPLFKTAERKLRHWNEVATEECPYLAMTQISEIFESRRGLPQRIQLVTRFHIYVKTQATQDSSIIPAQLLNPLVDAFCAALSIDDMKNFVCTLGGLVSHCWIEGQTETSEGLLGDTEVCSIPVQILVPT